MNNASLSVEEHKKLKSYVEELGMIYLCTPFSRTAADILEEMNVDAYKIGSGECNNYPLVKHIASFGKPIILSTGMNDINSITKSVEIIKQNEIDFALLHCTSMYPTPYDKVRLGSISHLSKEFPEATLGLSDHSLGNYTAFAAVALGASILEKHFTSNKLWEGPDVEISIDPNELKDLIKGTKAIHKALGGKKEILIEEKPTIDFAYASVVSIKDIKKGEKFNKDNIWVKRPGTGDIKAEYYSNILGKTAKKNISKDTQLRWDMISNE
jgi:N-acetylneuraminate synthase